MRPKTYHCQHEFGQHSRWAFRSAAQDGRYLQTWSTGAYLIDRVFMKPIIDKIFANEFLGTLLSTQCTIPPYPLSDRKQHLSHRMDKSYNNCSKTSTVFSLFLL